MGCKSNIESAPLASDTSRPLQQLQQTHFDRFVVHSLADFKAVDKLIVFKLNVEKLVMPPTDDDDINRSWQQAQAQDIFDIADQFDQLAQFVFAEGKAFEATRTGGDNVLAVQFRLLEYHPTTSKDGSWDNPTNMDKYVSSFGSAKIQAVLAKSSSGELVAVIEDTVNLTLGVAGRSFRYDGAMGSTNSKQNQKAAWRRAFKQWLVNLRSDLTRLKEQV
ncbi:hypothetical protein [Neptunicella marina]|uniref:DUF3313 domain-containing protein n=1 Tax=Neptunicella marina TaxID=2125989 RepID=A0A8J6IR69_9ALTE|nr:hypothetical protein [Neptunicella marina]MBC3765331.1 hypothetical protein [Neptunicella marina]